MKQIFILSSSPSSNTQRLNLRGPCEVLMFKGRWLVVFLLISCCTLAAVYAEVSAEAGQAQAPDLKVAKK